MTLLGLKFTVVSHEAKKAQSACPTKKNTWPLLWVMYITEHFCNFEKNMSYFNIHMVKSQTHERIRPSYHRHKLFMLVLYATWSFRAVCAIACWSSGCLPHTLMSFFKIWFLFSFLIFFVIATHLRAILPPESLHDKYWFYCGLLVQCTSTVKIAKNYLLVYKIAFVAFELRFKKCHHDCILFLVDGCRSKPVYHLMKMSKGKMVTQDCLVRVYRLVM